LAAHKEFTGTIGQIRMQARGYILAVETASMDDEVVKPGHLQEVAASWVEGLQQHQRPNAGLQRAVERVPARNSML
jgi:hypothetical protein